MIIKSLAKKPGFNNWALVQSILTIKIFREIDGVLQKAKLQKRCDLFDLLIPPYRWPHAKENKTRPKFS